jgi:5-methylcytosine-specific restriction endonuclease McrA
MNKVCSKCKESKSLDQFYKSKKDKYGVTSICKECSKRIVREYYSNNKDKRSKYQKEYYSNNKDKRSKYMKEYHNNNKNRISKQQKEYYYNNRDKRSENKKEYLKEYRKTERGKLIYKLNNQNRRYRKKYNTNPGDRLTTAQIEYLTEVYKHCAYCNTELTSENTHIDHIHPLSKDGSHSIDNVVLACKDCNLQKNAKTLDQWLKETGYNISIKHLVFIRLQET